MHPSLHPTAATALQLPNWRILAGMRMVTIDPISKKVIDQPLRVTYDDMPVQGPTPWWPDLTDTATAGCLVYLLGRGWSQMQRSDGTWLLTAPHGQSIEGSLLGEVAVRAAVGRGGWRADRGAVAVPLGQPLSERGAFVCTADKPYREEYVRFAGYRWVHPEAKYLRTREDWWDGDETDLYRCLHCSSVIEEYIPR